MAILLAWMLMDIFLELFGSEMFDGEYLTTKSLQLRRQEYSVMIKYLKIQILSVLSLDMPGVRMLDGSLSLARGSMVAQECTTILQVDS